MFSTWYQSTFIMTMKLLFHTFGPGINITIIIIIITSTIEQLIYFSYTERMSAKELRPYTFLMVTTKVSF